MSPIAGELVTDRFDYDGGREVTVYLPAKPAEAVVFAADGGWHVTRLVGAMEKAETPSTMIVGVHGMDGDDGRFREYVPGVDPERFGAHQSFILDHVVPSVETRFGIALGRDRTAVWGASLGGEFALAMGFSRPERFGAIFCASPGGGYRPPDSIASDVPATYLVAGNQEEFFVENARRWGDALSAAKARVTMTVRDGDHGGEFWYSEFPLMVNWAFGH